jgi:protein ImuA
LLPEVDVMAMSAVARDTVFALRRQIAKIEGTLPERLQAPGALKAIPGKVRSGFPSGIAEKQISTDAAGSDLTIVRHGLAVASADAFLQTGIERLDTALGGGLPKAALSEIHGLATRDAGAVAGFALSLASLILKQKQGLPILWVGTAEIFHEAGLPYARGLDTLFGIAPGQLLLSEAPKLVDALWIAEEAARMTAFAAVILEIRGSPQRLDLTATRRLHARARNADRPVLLLRQAGEADPTAAPVRLIVSAAPSASRATIAGPLAGSIGRPAFKVDIGKSRTALPGQFILEWNPDEHAFAQRTENSVAVVPASGRRADPAPASGAVLAFPAGASPAAISPTAIPPTARDQPSRQQHPAHRGPRRAG